MHARLPVGADLDPPPCGAQGNPPTPGYQASTAINMLRVPLQMHGRTPRRGGSGSVRRYTRGNPIRQAIRDGDHYVILDII